MGSIFFLGWLLATFYVPRMGDLNGRKLPFLLSFFMSIVAYTGLILSTEIEVTIFLFFILGMCQEGKLSVCFVYLLEIIPHHYKGVAGAVNGVIESSTLLMIALYFRYISKDWLYYQLFGLSLNTFAFLALLIIPDSPKY